MDYSAKYLFQNNKINISSDDIYYFINYFQWNKVKDLPKDDQKRLNCIRILNFKKGDRECYAYFAKCLKAHLPDLGNGEWLICSIPGHDQIHASPNNMDNFIKYVTLPNNIHPVIGLIIRSKAMLEKHGSNYGLRTVEKDLDSFKIGNTRDIKQKNIIVLDDITTSGCSLTAAKRFLKSKGANKIVCIALGKTIEDYGGSTDFFF